MAFAKRWVQRFFEEFDARVDAPTRDAVMQACGRRCFAGSTQKPPETPGLAAIDAFIQRYNQRAGEDAARRDGSTMHLAYVKNSQGQRVADGYCLCPLVEDGPEGLSPTYCSCSMGYVQAMFERLSGQTVRVALLESRYRGGKACRFRIDLGA